MAGNWLLRLVPRTPQGDFSYIVLEIDPADPAVGVAPLKIPSFCPAVRSFHAVATPPTVSTTKPNLKETYDLEFVQNLPEAIRRFSPSVVPPPDSPYSAEGAARPAGNRLRRARKQAELHRLLHGVDHVGALGQEDDDVRVRRLGLDDRCN